MIVIIKKRTPAAEIERITQELRRWKNIVPEEIVGQK